MKFFIDNNLSTYLAAGMKGFGEEVMHLCDQFPPDTVDTKWLEYIGNNGYVLVSRDEKLRWNPAEIYALKTFKVGAFFLGGKGRTRCELIQQLVRNWPKMKKLAESTNPPYVFRIPPSGTKFVKLTL